MVRVWIFEGVHQRPLVVFSFLHNDQPIHDPENKKQVCICWSIKDCRNPLQVRAFSCALYQFMRAQLWPLLLTVC